MVKKIKERMSHLRLGDSLDKVRRRGRRIINNVFNDIIIIYIIIILLLEVPTLKTEVACSCVQYIEIIMSRKLKMVLYIIIYNYVLAIDYYIACVYIITHTHTYTRTRTHAHAHTHTHTHTCSNS